MPQPESCAVGLMISRPSGCDCGPHVKANQKQCVVLSETSILILPLSRVSNIPEEEAGRMQETENGKRAVKCLLDMPWLPHSWTHSRCDSCKEQCQIKQPKSQHRPAEDLLPLTVPEKLFDVDRCWGQGRDHSLLKMWPLGGFP